MSRMFGERIQEFVLSVDIMTEDTFHLLLDLINTYVKRQLDIVYFSVLEQEPVDGKPGLSTYWTTRRDKPNYAVPEDEEYESHAAFSSARKHPSGL